MPGDRYQADVYATEKSILVFRKHFHPSCPVEPIKEHEEMEEAIDKHEEREAAENQKDATA